MHNGITSDSSLKSGTLNCARCACLEIYMEVSTEMEVVFRFWFEILGI